MGTQSASGAEFIRLGELEAATSGDLVVSVESSFKLARMPSVGMRRSTRVFVPKTKEGEVVRVLRSGRRLWVKSSGDGVLKVGKGGEQWLRLIDSNRGRVVVRSKENGWNNEAEIMEIDDDEEEKVVAPDL
ncbi:hypothetical protein Ancab_001218 [Ancistrocladus abbreviatus]